MTATISTQLTLTRRLRQTTMKEQCKAWKSKHKANKRPREPHRTHHALDISLRALGITRCQHGTSTELLCPARAVAKQRQVFARRAIALQLLRVLGDARVAFTARLILGGATGVFQLCRTRVILAKCVDLDSTPRRITDHELADHQPIIALTHCSNN